MQTAIFRTFTKFCFALLFIVVQGGHLKASDKDTFEPLLSFRYLNIYYAFSEKHFEIVKVGIIDDPIFDPTKQQLITVDIKNQFDTYKLDIYGKESFYGWLRNREIRCEKYKKARKESNSKTTKATKPIDVAPEILIFEEEKQRFTGPFGHFRTLNTEELEKNVIYAKTFSPRQKFNKTKTQHSYKKPANDLTGVNRSKGFILYPHELKIACQRLEGLIYGIVKELDILDVVTTKYNRDFIENVKSWSLEDVSNWCYLKNFIQKIQISIDEDVRRGKDGSYISPVSSAKKERDLSDDKGKILAILNFDELGKHRKKIYEGVKFKINNTTALNSLNLNKSASLSMDDMVEVSEDNSSIDNQGLMKKGGLLGKFYTTNEETEKYSYSPCVDAKSKKPISTEFIKFTKNKNNENKRTMIFYFDRNLWGYKKKEIPLIVVEYEDTQYIEKSFPYRAHMEEEYRAFSVLDSHRTYYKEVIEELTIGDRESTKDIPIKNGGAVKKIQLHYAKSELDFSFDNRYAILKEIRETPDNNEVIKKWKYNEESLKIYKYLYEIYKQQLIRQGNLHKTLHVKQYTSVGIRKYISFDIESYIPEAWRLVFLSPEAESEILKLQKPKSEAKEQGNTNKEVSSSEHWIYSYNPFGKYNAPAQKVVKMKEGPLDLTNIGLIDDDLAQSQFTPKELELTAIFAPYETVDISANIGLSGIYHYCLSKQLKELTVKDCSISSLNFLSDLKFLKYLDVSNNNVSISISDFAAFKNIFEKLNNLTHLILAKNEVVNVDSFQFLSKLEELDVSYNKIETLDPLGKSANLRKINAANNLLAGKWQFVLPLQSKLLEELDVSGCGNKFIVKNIYEEENGIKNSIKTLKKLKDNHETKTWQ